MSDAEPMYKSAKGVLFSPMMVPSLVATMEPKRVTRRTVEELPGTPGLRDCVGEGWRWNGSVDAPCMVRGDDVRPFKRFRYGGEGTLLYVRESWAIPNGRDWRTTPREDVRYAAVHYINPRTHRSRSGLFMPRRYARIILQITKLSIERLHAIDDDEVRREGIMAWSKDGDLWKYSPPDRMNDGPLWLWQECAQTARDGFQKAWTMLHGDDSWSSNPLVWRIGFRLVEVLRA